MRFLFLLIFLGTCLSAQEVDLVKFGQDTFHNLGCAECHSEAKDDDSFKTGPGVYGLFQKHPRARQVLAGGEKHDQEIKADWQYFLQSIRSPNEDLATAEQGAGLGKAFLPVMPPYSSEVLSDFQAKAIFQYLLTLNDADTKGPAKVMAKPPKQTSGNDPIADPYEILVTDRTRIYRTRIKGQSSRAVYVGTPTGINYAFDPVSLSIERIWFGGFLNIKGSLSGRGQKPSKLGYLAQEVDLKAPLLVPIDPTTGKAVDLSFKSPRMGDYKTIVDTLQSEKDFSTELAEANASFLGYQHSTDPTFHFQVGENKLSLQLTISVIGEAKLTLTGTLAEPQTFNLAPIIKGKSSSWTVTSLPAELEFTIPVQSAWRPTLAKAPPTQQQLKQSPASKIRLPRHYSATQVTAPTDPHGREQLFEPLGMTNGRDGSLIVATRTAGIWTLKDSIWTQVAEGLQDCLGVIEEENGDLVVGQKPELTRLIDTDSDGWYDTYQTLSEAFLATSNYHEYVHGPALDRNGNYYIALNLTHHNKKGAIYKAGGKHMGTQGGYRGWALRVTPSGETTPFANGLRSPAGLATGPDGHLYYTENQGEYVGTSKLFKLEKDKFYGHPSGLVDLPEMTPQSEKIQWDKVQSTKQKALALMPHSRIANAPGSPTWRTDDGKQMLVGDQTLSTLFAINLHDNNEAALIPFADQFPSGLMRLTLAPDQKLYIGQTGRGWRSKGGSQHALIILEQNENEPTNRLTDITRNGTEFTLSFSQQAPKLATSESLAIKSWTYLDSPKYGSAENDQIDHPILEITSDEEQNAITITLESIPNDHKNRVYSFTSKQLPATKGDLFEAFYSIVNQ